MRDICVCLVKIRAQIIPNKFFKKRMSEPEYLRLNEITKKGFCNSACQELLVSSAMWISAAVGFVSLALVTNLIRRNLKSFTAPEIQEKLISNITSFNAQFN
jgi:hypothetical protein